MMKNNCIFCDSTNLFPKKYSIPVELDGQKTM